MEPQRMLIEIEGVRPALLSMDGWRSLNELRGFRHVFRHAYSYGLDKERVSALLCKILDQQDIVTSDLQIFRNTVAVFATEAQQTTYRLPLMIKYQKLPENILLLLPKASD